jgi:hypothetical protein
MEGVGDEVLEFRVAEVGGGGHHVAAIEDGCGDAVVVGGSTGGKVGLFVEAEQRRTVERTSLAIVVALGAAHFVDLVAVGLLGVELVERCGRRNAVAAG